MLPPSGATAPAAAGFARGLPGKLRVGELIFQWIDRPSGSTESGQLTLAGKMHRPEHGLAWNFRVGG